MPDINTKIRLLKTCSSVLKIKVLKSCPNKIGLVSRFSECPSCKKSWCFPYYFCSCIDSMHLFICLYLSELMVTALYLGGLARVCWFLSFLVQSVCFSVLHKVMLMSVDFFILNKLVPCLLYTCRRILHPVVYSV